MGSDQQIIPVQRDNLVNQVSTNGSLTFPNRESLTFGIQGTVGEVLVEEGQQVEEGQPLASLDPVTVASLEKAVAAARISVGDAQEALDEVKTGPTEEDTAKTESQVDSANTSLANAMGDLRLTQRDWEDRVQAAEDDLYTAMIGYQGVFEKWLGIDVDQEGAALTPDTLLDSWGVDLTSVFAPNLKFQDTNWGVFAEGPPADDPTTRWSELTVYFWMNLYPGRIAPTCDNGLVPLEGQCIELEMNNSWETYQETKDSLDTVQVQAAKAIATAQVAATRAEESLGTAQEELADLEEGSNPLEFALREAEVTLAELTLEAELERLRRAILTAPMDGLVSLVSVEAGRSVSANSPIVEIVDPTVVEVDGTVDEIDVLFVRKGARADVTMDALPGQVLEGTVSSIASAAQNQQGVVSYPIRIQVHLPDGVELVEGLSATANIVIREEINVLLVPNQALYGSFEQPVLKVMSKGSIEERAVVLGNTDGFWTVVSQGVAEGEEVVMETTQAATIGQFGGFGGGSGVLPGGGGFGRGSGFPGGGVGRP